MDAISINLPVSKLKVLRRLLDIAEEPHKMNCSPVHIVEKLRDLDHADIIALKTEFQKLS